MKNFYLLISVFLIISMLTIPFVTLISPGSSKKPTAPNAPAPVKTIDKPEIRVKQGEEIKSMPMEDYLICVLGAEIPADYEEEAIKAQAVAAYTFALYKKNINADKGFDISADPSVDQAFMDTDKLKEKWGENYSQNCEKIKNCIKSVSGIYVSYKDAPIYAAYHAISSGKTENCSDVFSDGCPYLKSVESIGDLICPDYLVTVDITAADFKQKFPSECRFSQNPSEYITEIVRSDSGGIKTAAVGGKTMSGSEIRKALGLRSANFDIKVDRDRFIFTTRGYGHGVGMSQNGANYMAQTGSKYDEILMWYYTDCVLIS